MVIKLIRTDTVHPTKIQLPLGEQIIGRGKLLECDDKRISRQHGKLEVSGVSLAIKALHQNPCFFIKKGTTDTEILRQDNSVNLCNGDRFGLLPDAFWYEVLLCSDIEETNNCDTEECEKNTEEYCVENNDCDDKTMSDETNCDKSKTKEVNLSEDGTDFERAESPSLIGNSDPAHVLNDGTSSVKNAAESESNCLNELDMCNTKEPPIQNEPSDTNPNNKDDTNAQIEPIVQSGSNEEQPSNSEEQNNEVQTASLTVKRSHSPENSDVKKIKIEPGEVKTENDDVKPGPSLNQAQVPTAQPADDGAPSANNAAPNNNKPLRERCMYGGNCYRRNPQHLSQFSHPRDNDWGPGQRGVCPYGAACMKTDPRHWRDHDHPPGTIPPARPGMQVVQKHGNVFFINARSVNFYDDHFQVEDSDGDSVDFDYEF